MKEAAHPPQLIRFDSFEVNLRSAELWRNGERIKMPRQSFQIFAMLLEQPGEVVMRDEIQKTLWPNDTVVEFENSINAAVKRLRLALEDSADKPRYVETLARRGYRWMVPVKWVDARPFTPQDAAPARSLPPETRPVVRWRKLAVGAVVALLIASVVSWFARVHRLPANPQPEPKLRQLTTNSFENRVLSGAISPDGKYMAYSDANGIRLQLVATGRRMRHQESAMNEVMRFIIIILYYSFALFHLSNHPVLC